MRDRGIAIIAILEIFVLRKAKLRDITSSKVSLVLLIGLKLSVASCGGVGRNLSLLIAIGGSAFRGGFC